MGDDAKLNNVLTKKEGGFLSLSLCCALFYHGRHAWRRVSGVCQDAYFLSQLSTRRPGIHGTRDSDSCSGNGSGTTRENLSL